MQACTQDFFVFNNHKLRVIKTSCLDSTVV